MIINLRVLQLPVPFRNWVSITGPGGTVGTSLGLEGLLSPPVLLPSLGLSALSYIQEQEILFRYVGAPAELKELVDACGDWVAVLVQGVK